MRTSYQRIVRTGILLALVLLVLGQLRAQDTSRVEYPWNLISMTDYRMKPGVVWIKVPPPKGGMPIWIPIGGGVVVSGGVVYLITRPDDDGPEPTPLLLQDDQLTVSCGQELSFNPLLNDQGDGIRITNVTSTAGISINWQASGLISISGLPNSGSTTLTVFVEDSQGQAGQQNVVIQITSPPISAVDDAYVTDFQTTISGNVLGNDQGTEHSVTDFSQASGGELSMQPNGAFTFVPHPDFSGETSFTYTIIDQCEQTANATVTITVHPPDCSFSLQIETTPTNCGLNTGAATANVDPPGSYTYSWSNGSTLSEVDGLAGGEISVTVTSEVSMCTESASGSVEELAPAYIVSSSGMAGNCLGEGTDILLTTQSPASGPMLILMEGGPTLEVPVGAVSLASLTTILPGTYTLSIYDSSIGESCTESVVVTVPDNSTAPNAANDSYNTAAATSLSANVLDNDQGLNNTLTTVDNVVGGTVAFDPNGQFTFEPFPDFTGAAGFVYTLVDACGTTASATVIINVLPAGCTFSVSISTTAAGCGLANGIATATISEPGDYSYSWSNGSTGATLSNLPAGSVQVTVTDLPDGLCPMTASGTVEELPPAVFTSVLPIGGNCLGEGADCIIDFSIAETGPIVVTLNDGSSFQVPATIVSLAEYTTLFPGAYELSAYAAASGADCSVFTSFVIPDISLMPEAIPDNYTTPFQTTISANVLDNDSALQASLTEVSAVSGGTVNSLPNGEFTFEPFPDFTGAGGFVYTLTDACGATANATVVINVLPPDCAFTVSISTTAAGCGLANGIATATISEPGDYSYSWSNGSTGATLSNLPAGSVQVTVTDLPNGLCPMTASGTVEELPPAVFTSVEPIGGNCLGEGADCIIDFSIAGTGPVVVTLNDGTSFQVPASTVSLAEYTALFPGAYELSAYAAASGADCSVSTSFVIPDNSPIPEAIQDSYTTPFQTTISGNVLDNDTALQASLTEVDAVSGGTVNSLPNGEFTFEPFPDFTGVGGFSYTLTDACGATANATVVINVLPPDCAFTVSISTTAAGCGLANGIATATISEPGDYSYSWSNGSTGATLSNLPAGNVQVTVTDLPDGLCPMTASGTVEELPPAVFTSVEPIGGNCLGEGADCIIDFSIAGTGPIVVTLNDGTSFQVPASTVSLAEYTALFPGAYELSAYAAASGADCSVSNSFVIPDNSPIPEAIPDSYTTPFQITISGNVLDNDSALQASLTEVSAVIGGTVNFLANGEFTFDPSPGFVGQASFIYVMTDACGETASATVVINVLPPDCTYNVTIDTTPADCGMANGSATAIVSEPGTYNYLWSDGSTDITAMNLGAGMYTVTVTAFNGSCSDSATAQVLENEVSYIQTLQTIPGDCFGNGAEIELQTSINGSGTLTITLNGETVSGLPQGNLSLSNWFDLFPGDFTLSVYDSSLGEACSETDNGNIADNSPVPIATDDEYSTPFETLVGGNVLDNDEGLSLSLVDVYNTIGGTVNFLSNGGFTFSPLEGFSGTGGFTYLATDVCGVSVTAMVQITVETPFCTFSVTATATDADCGLTNGSAEASVDEPGDYTYIWSDGQVGAMIENLEAGDYNVTVTGSTGCSDEATVTVNEIPGQYIDDLLTVAPSCGEPGEIHLTVSSDISTALLIKVQHPGGVESFITESSSVLLSDHIPIVPGIYTITVEDPAQGPACAETVSILLEGGSTGPGIILVESIPPSGPTALDGALVIMIEPYTVPPFSLFVNGELCCSVVGEVFTISGLPAGFYTVQVIDALGCSSNVIETVLSSTQPLVSWEVLTGQPIAPPQASIGNSIEHPEQKPLLFGASMGTQLSVSRSGERYQLALWQVRGANLSGQLSQANWQKAWQGTNWSLWSGPAAGYLRIHTVDSRIKTTELFAYWATDLTWRPTSDAPWSLDLSTAVGRKDGWWWQTGLRVRVKL